jgi:endonuclease YncB( thermonuclease family)
LRACAWLAAAALLAAAPACGEQIFAGAVVRVADGDTITVRVGDENVKVRLAEIDAPERGQPWGKRAKQALLDKVGGRDVEVSWRFTDRYGRRVGHARCGGHDVNRELVREGHAWVYRHWMSDRTLLDDEQYARDGHVGLWSLPENERVPPWEWREAQRASR